MIGARRPPGEFLRPGQVGIERGDLRRRRDEEIVALEKHADRLIPGRAHQRRSGDVGGRKRQGVFDFVHGFGLQQRALLRVLVIGQQSCAQLPGTKPQPSLQHGVDRIIGHGLVDRAAELLKCLERTFGDLQRTRLVTDMTAEIADPGDALAFEIDVERALQIVGAGNRHRHAGVVAGLHAQQHREVGHVARHRAEHAHRWKPGVASVGRHAADAGAETVDVVPGGGIAQAAAVIAAVGDRQHAQRQRDRRAAAAAAGRARLVVGVARDAVHLVIGVRAEPEFRRVGLADEDRAGLAQPFDHDAVGGRNGVLEDRRAEGVRKILDGGEILHREGKAVQRSEPARRARVARRVRALAPASRRGSAARRWRSRVG